MKKLLIIFAALVLVYGCQKQNDQTIDKWKGYESFYKSGPVTKTLWAGQHINVGTVVYEFIEDENGVALLGVLSITSSTYVFHSPQEAHFPTHLGD